MKIITPITFFEKLIRKNELGQPFALRDHQREVLCLAFAFDQDGRLPWDTIVYSCVKKSGKTTINAGLNKAPSRGSRGAERDFDSRQRPGAIPRARIFHDGKDHRL
jgi:hypothetical protein